jgi:peptidoglycan/xylan/chitin deacetylase (PgdA/CDA1 family)
MRGIFFMKSKSRKKRKINRKRRIYKNKKSFKSIFILLALIILFIFCCLSISVLRRSDKKYTNAEHFKNIALTPPPSPTPTIIPTSTPVPLIGYCLNVPVLMYHHIQPDAEALNKGQKALSVDNGAFDQQMSYLASSGYSAISAQQLVDALAGNTGLPSKSIVITFDDGYSDIYAYAYPVLQKYHIVGNIAVVTGLVGGADYVSWGQIEEMSRSGLMYMINHTWSHYAIAYGSYDKARYEIATAKQQLQDHTGQNINTFVYPYGAVTTSAINALQQEGVKGAFSEIGGHWQCDSFIMALHRTRIGNSSLSSYGL